MTTQRAIVASMLLFYIGIAVWVGSLVFFGFAVAPVVFKHLPSKDMAGGLNAIILSRMNTLEFVACSLTLAGVVLFALREKGVRAWSSVAAVAVMAALLCAYAWGIFPAMNDLRSQIHSFDMPQSSDYPLVERFRIYHGWYSRLVIGVLLLGVFTLVWQTLLYAQKLKSEAA